MFTKDWFKILEIVEKSYIGFRPFRDGSKKDKRRIVILWIFFAVLACLFFLVRVADKKLNTIITPLFNLILQMASKIVLMGYTIFFIKYLRKKDRTENFIYMKGQKGEEEFLLKFLFNLSKNGVSMSMYPNIIEYYENRIQKEKNEKKNGVYSYITAFLLPLFISYFAAQKIIGSDILQLSIASLPFIKIVNDILNRKLYMYEHIVYYLKLQMQIAKL